MNEYQKYNTALQIDNNSEMFSYGMRTDIGNAFVHGDLKAVDTVTYPEIGGAYMYVEKIKEKYTMHTRTVTYTTGSGKTRQTHTRTETYWTSLIQKCMKYILPVVEAKVIVGRYRDLYKIV